MARTIDAAKRVVNGTFGEVWVDGEKIAECTACQLKVSKIRRQSTCAGSL